MSQAQLNRVCALIVATCLSWSVLIAASGARAQLCESDSECPTGQACTKYPPGPCCSCSPDVCPGAVAACEAEANVARCTEKECESDGDCAEHMVCWKRTESVCEQPNCCDGDDSCVGRGTSCEDVALHTCVPRFIPPCERASDCGEGFACAEDRQWVCRACKPGESNTGGSSGSAGSSASDASSTCCVNVPRMTCKLRALPCEADSTCPTPLRCDDNYDHYDCGTGFGGSGGSAPELSECDTKPNTSAKLCGLRGYAGFSPAMYPDAEQDAGPGPSTGGSSGQAGAGGGGGSSSGRGGKGGVGADAGTSGTGGKASHPDDSAASDSSGCAVAHPGTNRSSVLALALAAVLALALCARPARRRRDRS